jgi:leucyl-tRNA synthetase
LLYSRFLIKVLYDLDLVPTDEPFTNLLTQGMVLKDGSKMSKSKGNVVSPEEIIGRYGADTARLFILFAAPPERDLDWSDQGVEGAYRFINRVWRLYQICGVAGGASLQQTAERPEQLSDAERELRLAAHRTILKVTEDVGARFNFNTAVSSIMEMVNAIYQYIGNYSSFQTTVRGPAATESESAPSGSGTRSWVLEESLISLVLLLAPFTPHLSEEIWGAMGREGSVHQQRWPEYDAQALVVDEVEIVVQVNGRVRDRLSVPAGIGSQEMEQVVLRQPRVQELLSDKKLLRAVCIPGKLVNLVVDAG